MTSDPHPLPTTPPGPARRAVTVLLALVMIGMPLIIACQKGHLEVARLLRDAGADLNQAMECEIGRAHV